MTPADALLQEFPKLALGLVLCVALLFAFDQALSWYIRRKKRIDPEWGARFDELQRARRRE
jgi:hypothetical protein